MKKILVLLLSLLAITFTSCKKEEKPNDIVNITFGYKMIESGSLYTKSAYVPEKKFDVKDFMSRHLPSDDYTLKLKDQNGKETFLRGKWSENKTFSITKGVYTVSFETRSFKNPSISSKMVVDIKENKNYILEAQYNSYLIISYIDECNFTFEDDYRRSTNAYTDSESKVYYCFYDLSTKLNITPKDNNVASSITHNLTTQYDGKNPYVEAGKYYIVHPKYEDKVSPTFSYTLPDMTEGIIN